MIESPQNKKILVLAIRKIIKMQLVNHVENPMHICMDLLLIMFFNVPYFTKFIHSVQQTYFLAMTTERANTI